MTSTHTGLPIKNKLAQPSDNDGWVRICTNKLLLWVPVDYRHGLDDQSIMSMPADGSVVIDCDRFRHGTSWVEVHA